MKRKKNRSNGDDDTRPKAQGKIEKELERLHVELVKLQQWVVHAGLKVCIVFEGRDGPAKAARSRRSPNESVRASSAWSRCLRRPSARKVRCISQRYLPHMPAAGEVVIFDRSWYNRAGVERVMGFTEQATRREVPAE